MVGGGSSSGLSREPVPGSGRRERTLSFVHPTTIPFYTSMCVGGPTGLLSCGVLFKTEIANQASRLPEL